MQRYKIWEQFTTVVKYCSAVGLLFQTCKDTKFESNSQLSVPSWLNQSNCFRRAKIQNLRAIHNFIVILRLELDIVSDVQRYKIWEQFTTSPTGIRNTHILFQTCKDTKFESNSQPILFAIAAPANCFRRAKIQNLRAIHNAKNVGQAVFGIVSDVQRYKIWEQFTTFTYTVGYPNALFQTCKDTKFESNSQQNYWNISLVVIVSDVQRYKIWEQFTTNRFIL